MGFGLGRFRGARVGLGKGRAGLGIREKGLGRVGQGFRARARTGKDWRI